jgi:hypothetical protein
MMKKLDFPSLVNALKPVVEAKEFILHSGYRDIHEFYDEFWQNVKDTWEGCFEEKTIFIRGTGVSALSRISILLLQLASTFGEPIPRYLRKIRERFPIRDWRSGSGRLAIIRGGGAGAKIVDEIFIELLDTSLIDEHAETQIRAVDASLCDKVKLLLRPSNWKPFVRDFVRQETPKKGVYLLVILDRNLSTRLRAGSSKNLVQRLNEHFQNSDRPIFFASKPTQQYEKAECALYHLIPQSIRIGNHPPRRERWCNILH